MSHSDDCRAWSREFMDDSLIHREEREARVVAEVLYRLAVQGKVVPALLLLKCRHDGKARDNQ